MIFPTPRGGLHALPRAEPGERSLWRNVTSFGCVVGSWSARELGPYLWRVRVRVSTAVCPSSPIASTRNEHLIRLMRRSTCNKWADTIRRSLAGFPGLASPLAVAIVTPCFESLALRASAGLTTSRAFSVVCRLVNTENGHPDERSLPILGTERPLKPPTNEPARRVRLAVEAVGVPGRHRHIERRPRRGLGKRNRGSVVDRLQHFDARDP